MSGLELYVDHPANLPIQTRSNLGDASYYTMKHRSFLFPFRLSSDAAWKRWEDGWADASDGYRKRDEYLMEEPDVLIGNACWEEGSENVVLGWENEKQLEWDKSEE
jgi:hypothetical protein